MFETSTITGEHIHALVSELFPIHRSITGNGVRASLEIIKRELPGLVIHEVPTGTACFDWTVPNEWNIRDAYILDPNGDKIVDFNESNLHVVAYSMPIDRIVSLEQLQQHLHSYPEQPDAVPYVTSFYEERWGFCISENQRCALKPGDYRVVIDSTLESGSLTYGELVVPGETASEILVSTYICHPAMANNELSGPCVTTFLAKWVLGQTALKYTYRFVFKPETIGTLVYLSRNLDHLKQNVRAAFNVSCVGDDRTYSFMPSRDGQTLSDRVALHVLKNNHPEFKSYSFQRDRGSDERQYCWPGIDLPVTSVMRTKYGEFPEYHTSSDNLDLVTPAGLLGGFEVLRQCFICLEKNVVVQSTTLGEPQLGKRNLYPTLSDASSTLGPGNIIHLLAYGDGTRDLIGLADLLEVAVWDIFDLVDLLERHKLVSIRHPTDNGDLK